jgi:hypothetical protein
MATLGLPATLIFSFRTAMKTSARFLPPCKSFGAETFPESVRPKNWLNLA